MKKLKIISLIMAISLATAAFAGCAQSSNEPTTKGGSSDSNAGAPAAPDKYKVMAGFRPQNADFKDMSVLQTIQKEANVEITWELVPDNALAEKKNLALSTGDLPDGFAGMLNDTDVIKNSKMLLRLSDHLDKAPNSKKLFESDKDLKSYMTMPDGAIYSFPWSQEKEYEGFYDNLYINKQWLEKLGLKMPNNAKDFEDVLTAFKTKDPNGNGKADEIPMTFMLTHNYFGLFSMYGIFGRIDNPNRLVIENGKVIFSANKEEWKNATKWFKSLYAKGLLDPEGFTQDRSQLFAKGKSDPMLIGVTNAFLIDNVVGAKRVPDYSYLPPIEGSDGKRITRFSSNPIASRSSNVISASTKNPDGLIRFFDACLDEEKEYSIQTTYGLIGKQLVKSMDPAYKYEFAVASDGMSQDDFRFKDAPTNMPIYIPSSIYKTLKPAPDVARKIAYLEQARPYLQKESLPPILLTDEETKELSTISTGINEYVTQQQALWIAGKANIDKEWDSFVSKLKAMKVDRYVEIHQAAMDRYYGK